MTCRNCATAYEDNFCPHCGQAATTRRITVGQLVSDAVFSVVKVNRGFLFTAKALTLRPGSVIRQYVQGRRVDYYPPHKYLFLIGAVATFLNERYHLFATEYESVMVLNRSINHFLERFFK